MLVTVYKVLYPGLEQVTQYYRWNITIPQEEDRPRQQAPSGRWRYTDNEIACPGCGANLRRWSIFNPHHCPGTLTDHPVTPSRNKKIYSTKENDAKLKEYVANLPHTVQISD